MDRTSILTALTAATGSTLEGELIKGAYQGEAVTYITPEDTSISNLQQLYEQENGSSKVIFFFGIDIPKEITDFCKETYGVYGYYTAYMQGEDLFLKAGLHFKDRSYYDFKTKVLYEG
ncbi:hypothetical protein [Algivirga pacifica]|uniref:Uncharacterized protein n=1 Tax=Algivirga pacifica TaxID=1162670 RepID=A0ABP9CX27_9BACT